MINQSDILRQTLFSVVRESSVLVEEARQQGKQTAFLSHSYKDRELAKRVQSYLQSKGWQIYVDWQDTSMPAKPNRATADKIKRRIKQLHWFLYLATANSSNSKWCPWEIGYADGIKIIERIIIIPTTDGNLNYGSEYLDLYRRVDQRLLQEDVGLIDPDSRFVPLHSISLR